MIDITVPSVLSHSPLHLVDSPLPNGGFEVKCNGVRVCGVVETSAGWQVYRLYHGETSEFLREDIQPNQLGLPTVIVPS